MRRAVLTVLTTVVGLVLLLGFKTQPLAPTTASARPATAAAPAASGAPPAAGSPPAGSPPADAAPADAAPQQVTGDTVDTRYGPVQVRATVTGGRLTDVTATTLPTEHARSVGIDERAVPQLREEAIAAQSASIDMVSGATFTSEGYSKSLQSALDQVPALGQGQG